MADVFTDDFETNDLSKWGTIFEQGAGSDILTTAGAAKNGSYGCRSTVAATSSAVAAMYQYAPAWSGNLWEGEVWFRLSAVPSPGNADPIGLVGARYDSPVWNMGAGLFMSNAGVFWRLRRRDGSWHIPTTGLTLYASTWKFIRFQFDNSGANPVHKLQYDGQEYTYTDSSTGTVVSPRSLLLGWWYATTSVSADIDFDDAVERDTLTPFETPAAPLVFRRPVRHLRLR